MRQRTAHFSIPWLLWSGWKSRFQRVVAVYGAIIPQLAHWVQTDQL